MNTLTWIEIVISGIIIMSYIYIIVFLLLDNNKNHRPIKYSDIIPDDFDKQIDLYIWKLKELDKAYQKFLHQQKMVDNRIENAKKHLKTLEK